MRSQKQIRGDREALRLGIDAAAVQKAAHPRYDRREQAAQQAWASTHAHAQVEAEEAQRIFVVWSSPSSAKRTRHRKALNKMLASYLEVEIPCRQQRRRGRQRRSNGDDDEHDDRDQSGDESVVVCDQELEEMEIRAQEEEEAAARQALMSTPSWKRSGMGFRTRSVSLLGCFVGARFDGLR